MSSSLAIWGILISHRVRLMAVPEVKPKCQGKALCSVTGPSAQTQAPPLGCYSCTLPPPHSASLPFDKYSLQPGLRLTPNQQRAAGSRSCPWICRAPALAAPRLSHPPAPSSAGTGAAVFFPPIFVSNQVFSLQPHHFSLSSPIASLIGDRTEIQPVA